MSTRWGELFLDHDGYVVDKWEQYLDIYQETVGPLIELEEPISLLEIGVQNGGALEIWGKYLPLGSRIIGLDINPDVSKLSFDNMNIEVHVADATNSEAVKEAIGDQKFDIIIDDGSHISSDIITSFEIFFPLLNSGGKFIIEDLHASYFPEFGGGYAAPSSAIAYLKNIVDGLHCDYIDMNIFTDEDRTRLKNFYKQVRSVTFHDSVTVIHKLNSERPGPYVRLLSGQRADVVPISKLAGSSATSATAIHLMRGAGDRRRQNTEWWQSDLQKQISDCPARTALVERQIKKTQKIGD